MERRDVASEEEEESDSAEEEGSFSPSEDEAEGADATAVSTTEGGAESLQAETDEAKGAHLAQEGAADKLEAEPAAEEEAAATSDAAADDDDDLEGALESVEEGMQALNVDDEVISQGGEEDPDEGQLGQGAPEQPAQQQGGPQERQPQPYDVPTKGTFWLHDDRHGGGDSRRRPVRRKKIWDPTDDPWKHDMFDQLEAGRSDRYEEPRRGSDRRGRRGGQRASARDYTRTGNFRAAASAEQSVVPDDEAPPGYEQPQFRQPHANGWAAAEAPAATAAGRSSGGGWWESGPAAVPEQPSTRERGQGRNRGQRQAVGQAAPGGQWASDEAQVADSSAGSGWEDDSSAAHSGATGRVPKAQQGSGARRKGPSQRGPAPTAFANAARQLHAGSEVTDGDQAVVDEAPRPASVASARSLNAGAQDFQPPAAGAPIQQAGGVPMAVQQQQQPQAAGAAPYAAAGPAGAAPQMVFVQAPGTPQPGMQYQYIMPAASSSPSQPAPPGGAWVQMAAGTPMSGGFQMVPAEVFGSGAQQAFIPGPMMMGMGYPLGMRPAMVKPVRRPITIQAPPDAQAAAGTDQSRMLNPSASTAPSRPGGRRYSAMTGRLAEDASAVRVASNA